MTPRWSTREVKECLAVEKSARVARTLATSWGQYLAMLSVELRAHLEII